MRFAILAIFATVAQVPVVPVLLTQDAGASCGGPGTGGFNGWANGCNTTCQELASEAEEDCSADSHFEAETNGCVVSMGCAVSVKGVCVQDGDEGYVPIIIYEFIPPKPNPTPDCVCGSSCRPEC